MPVVFVSDGGHFDNLGVYELIRRECKNILVFDAGEDAHRQLSDLFQLTSQLTTDARSEEWYCTYEYQTIESDKPSEEVLQVNASHL